MPMPYGIAIWAMVVSHTDTTLLRY